jgi:predicted Rossmann fold flavoprotein
LDLVEEDDGRMFPQANRSSAVVDCLRTAARRSGVQLITGAPVQSVARDLSGGFVASCRGGGRFHARRLLLATGGHPSGRRLAAQLGHRLIPPVPSLFSLTLDAPQLQGCAGVAVDDVLLTLEVGGERFRQIGRVLITHWGLSGPATLRLTAFAARTLQASRYRATLNVSWCSGWPQATLLEALREQRTKAARRTLAASRPLAEHLPRRLWLSMLKKVGVAADQRWADCPAKVEQGLLDQLQLCRYPVKGRGPFGEEFVTAGGVDLGEINLATMESRCCPGLHLAGELMDVDGVTGGFNFQHCWTSGWLAGQSAAGQLTGSDRTP